MLAVPKTVIPAITPNTILSEGSLRYVGSAAPIFSWEFQQERAKSFNQSNPREGKREQE